MIFRLSTYMSVTHDNVKLNGCTITADTCYDLQHGTAYGVAPHDGSQDAQLVELWRGLRSSGAENGLRLENGVRRVEESAVYKDHPRFHLTSEITGTVNFVKPQPGPHSGCAYHTQKQLTLTSLLLER